MFGLKSRLSDMFKIRPKNIKDIKYAIVMQRVLNHYTDVDKMTRTRLDEWFKNGIKQWARRGE